MKTLRCINVKPLVGNDVVPPLELNKEYEIKKVVMDKEGHEHFDVGLISKFNYITSKETGEILPNSMIGGIHWCHPSRFEVIN